MPTKTLYYIIKIGKEEHIKSLQDQGNLYMNPVSYFKKTEEEQRGDKNEGIVRIEQVEWLQLQNGDKIIEFKKDQPKDRLINAQLRIDDPDLHGNIYSMISLSSDIAANEAIKNNYNTVLGDTFLIITNVVEFLQRIVNQLNFLGLKYEYNFVSYYDHNAHTGDLTVFSKDIRFKHQSEFRIFVENPSDLPLQIQIGSIAEISKLVPIEQFKNISIKYKLSQQRK